MDLKKDLLDAETDEMEDAEEEMEPENQSVLIDYGIKPKKQTAQQVLRMMGGLHEKYRSLGDVSVQLRQRHRIDID